MLRARALHFCVLALSCALVWTANALVRARRESARLARLLVLTRDLLGRRLD